MKKYSWIVLGSLCAAFASGALADPGEGSAQRRGGHGAGNGGDGVRVNGRLVMLDFVEAGIEEAPAVREDSNPIQTFVERLTPVFAELEGAPVELLSRKLGEIGKLNPLLAYQLLLGIEKYQWRLVGYDLANIPDDEDTLVDAPLEQLAIRSVRAIRINRKRWLQLDPTNRIGLILHEIVYAFVSRDPEGRQSSRRARELVGHLFTPGYVEQGLEGLGRAGIDHFQLNLSSPNGESRLTGNLIEVVPFIVMRLDVLRSEDQPDQENGIFPGNSRGTRFMTYFFPWEMDKAEGSDEYLKMTRKTGQFLSQYQYWLKERTVHPKDRVVLSTALVRLRFTVRAEHGLSSDCLVGDDIPFSHDPNSRDRFSGMLDVSSFLSPDYYSRVDDGGYVTRSVNLRSLYSVALGQKLQQVEGDPEQMLGPAAIKNRVIAIFGEQVIPAFTFPTE